MTDIKFIDTSVWLAYFLSSAENARRIIECPGILYTSVLSLFEIRRRLIKSNIGDVQIYALLEFIRNRSILIQVTDDICIEAAFSKLPAMDALIYTSAVKNNSHFLTCDNDFRGLSGVTVLESTT